MFDQLTGEPAIFFLMVNRETGMDGGQGRRGSIGGRNHVVYRSQGRAQFGTILERDQWGLGIGQNHEQLARVCGRQFFQRPHVAGPKNLEMGDERSRGRSAAVRLFGEIASLVEGDDFVTGIETQSCSFLNWALFSWIRADAALTTRSDVTRVIQR